MNGGRRVVVTGMGLYSPIGNSPAEVMGSLHKGVSGIRRMPEWKEIKSLHTGVAGLCLGVDEALIPRKYRRSMGRVAVLAALSALDAIRDSGLGEEQVASPRCGVSFGSTAGSSTAQEEFLRKVLTTSSLHGLQSSIYTKFMSHTCAANLVIMLQSKGPVIASCTACVSGSQGIGFGYEAVRCGRADIMVAGGAEEMHFMDAGIFDIMHATSTKYNDEPDKTPRPFDAQRDGLVVGEGSGCLVLEEFEHARKRGANIHAEVAGYGTNADGSHITSPSAEGMAGAMLLALEDAGLSPDRVGHINAHATATEAGDIAESIAVHSVFGDRVPVSAFKGYMGHTLGGCGAIESIITILMMRNGFMAPTRNLESPEPRCAPIWHVRDTVMEKKFAVGMNNNFALGGVNTSLIFSLV